MSWSVAHVLGGAARVIVLATVALAGLLASTAAIAGVLALARGGDFRSLEYLTVGLVCSLLAGLFVAAFHLRKETMTLTAKHGEQFLHEAQTVLEELGYLVTNRTADSLATRPGFSSFLFGQGIHMNLDGDEARVTGPKLGVELLRYRLRVRAQFNHLQATQSTRTQRRLGESAIRRTELRLRFRPEQLDAVRQEVVDTLARDGDLTCQLHLVLHGGADQEQYVEQILRPWLEARGISFAVQKEVVHHADERRPEVVGAA